MNNIKFSKINKIIQDARRGKIFVLVDDEGRENEGDLIIPASKVSSKSINFMAKYGRGLICLALSHSQVSKLNLPLMSPSNNSRTQTAFTVSIEAKKGVTTGISAYDRAHTIRTAIKKNASSKDIALTRERLIHFRWMASKLIPIYGDKQQVNVDQKIEITWNTDENDMKNVSESTVVEAQQT